MLDTISLYAKRDGYWTLQYNKKIYLVRAISCPDGSQPGLEIELNSVPEMCTHVTTFTLKHIKGRVGCIPYVEWEVQHEGILLQVEGNILRVFVTGMPVYTS